MAKLGMETTAIEQLASQLDAHAKSLDGILGRVDGMSGRMRQSWFGPDAQDFDGWWHSKHKPAFIAAIESILGLVQSVRNNIAEQDRASAGHGGVGGSYPAVPLAPPHVGTTSPGMPAVGAFTSNDFHGGGAEFLRDWRDRGNGMDQWNFGYADPNKPGTGDCTSFVAWRLNELAHAKGLAWHFDNNSITGQTAPLPNGGRLGYAYQWGADATAAGFPPDNTPKVGAVAWYSQADSSGYGHVAIVREVRPDGSLQLEQSSYDGTAYDDSKIVYPGKAGYPTGFIHFLPGS